MERTLKLTESEISTILNALDMQPHHEVTALIRKIVHQVYGTIDYQSKEDTK